MDAALYIPYNPSPEPTGLCENCDERPATVRWVGSYGAMAIVRGGVQFWCERCTVIVNLAYAREQEERIPGLIARLAELDAP